MERIEIPKEFEELSEALKSEAPSGDWQVDSAEGSWKAPSEQEWATEPEDAKVPAKTAQLADATG